MLVLLLAGGFETSFWPRFFSSAPGPMIWLNVMVYLALYRRPASGIFTIYLLSFSLIGFTLAPIKMLWFPLLIIYLFIHLIKSRVFWSGPGYFVLMSSLSTLIYQISYISASKFLEPNMATYSLMTRLLQILLTPVFAWPVYKLLHTIDRVTNAEDLQHSGGLET